MHSQSSMDHLVRDLVVCWQRAVLLAALSVIGLAVWATCAIHAALNETGEIRATSVSVGAISESSPHAGSLFQKQHLSIELPVSIPVTQDLLGKRQQADPLARSIEVSAVHSKDFGTRIIPLSISVSSSADDKASSSTKNHASPTFRSETRE